MNDVNRIDSMASAMRLMRAARRDKELAQSDVADKLFISSGSLCRYERGKARISFDLAIKIFDFLGFDVVLVRRRR